MNTLRRLWRITSWPERAATALAPIVLIFAVFRGTLGEVVAWFVAGLWWFLYLGERLARDQIVDELWHLHVKHQKLVDGLRSRVHYPKGHRR